MVQAIEIASWAAKIKKNQSKIKQAIGAACKIVRREFGSKDLIGSGFLVSSKLVVTCRHVAIWLKDQGVSGTVDFKGENGSGASRSFDISSVKYLADKSEPDIAVLELDGTASGIIKLDDFGTPKKEQEILTIGFTSKGEGLGATAKEIHHEIFKGIYDVKRAAPGLIVSTRAKSFSHDCSVERNNSGSVCIAIDTGEIVGMHRAASGKLNQSVSAPEISAVLNRI